ncbi:MAG: sulfate ABC transporter substrate-binding protein [Chloroflexia bacterium]|nr:sulfate ABC transporter substrate-binding protein [Chloroflexia bacterium]
MRSHDCLLHVQGTLTRRQTLLALVAAAATPALGSALPRAALAQENVTLTLVAYSTPREAYEEIIPLFQATPEGAGVTFDTSYAASGEQSRAVESGLPADIVALSLAPDVDRLVEPGLVAEDWSADEYEGMVTDSIVVFAVRPGNPDEIAGWDDLIGEGIEVITPNPLTSGGAKWNIMAGYGAQLEQGKTEEEAVEYLRQLFTHVPVQDKSARESLATFLGGKGTVLLAYENEVITAQQAGEEIEYVIPEETILIENPVAVVTESANPEKAAAFVTFLRSPEAQRVFGEKGYRPIVPEILGEFEYPTPAGLFTIADHGGWPEVNAKFFDPDTGIVAQVQQG